MKVSVLGAGRWGSTIAWLQNQQKRQVILWNQEDEFLKEWQVKRKNSFLSLPKKVEITADFNLALSSEVIFISIRAQEFRNLCQNLKDLEVKNKLFMLAMKGLEMKTGKRLSEIFYEYLDKSNNVGMLAGPGHPQELTKNVPTLMTCAVAKKKDLARAVKYCQTDLMRVEQTDDLLGVEISSALKNVMGIVGGLFFGLGLDSLKGYLIVKGPEETARLIKAMKGKPLTAYGPAHLGDYAATVFSPYSRNHQVGEDFARTGKLGDAEGVPTITAVQKLIKKYKVKMPICEGIYQVFYKGLRPEKFVKRLFK
ncbi:MAG: glycerol-3-phosphate dehydrogenase [Candidatus Komeilibacteria bacterium CG10_big_fil_rev_8_21_14_0_10_41_13]|uniref:Glycerol-3-phosphate dehydrogenase n=1 Tax=Candidatus Komeilibacteria bacterium CG10_big_fil_rev_8_21_14_0_10_41_13 TaxID=1974476 RepID=A0A2M6WC38_9BACT|nr:MAG: glycerol-3-phosphate dehydrogenase [Candidatus Komeilibacteria bacterium CG10_big_fil_rev_8_21_14_0_10_41_13]